MCICSVNSFLTMLLQIVDAITSQMGQQELGHLATCLTDAALHCWMKPICSIMLANEQLTTYRSHKAAREMKFLSQPLGTLVAFKYSIRVKAISMATVDTVLYLLRNHYLVSELLEYFIEIAITLTQILENALMFMKMSFVDRCRITLSIFCIYFVNSASF